MTDKKFENIIELVYMGGGFLPANEKASELMETCGQGEIISLNEVTQRDLSFHKCYMSLLNYVWGYMPPKFKKTVTVKNFYKWLKHLKGQYSVDFEFKDGTKMVTYESIAFGNMSEKRFKEYIKEQLPFIYESVIGAYYKDTIFDNIVATIEKDYEKFFSKLK